VPYRCEIILWDKLNIRGKFMWQLTKNMDGGTTDANGIKLQGGKI